MLWSEKLGPETECSYFCGRIRNFCGLDMSAELMYARRYSPRLPPFPLACPFDSIGRAALVLSAWLARIFSVFCTLWNKSEWNQGPLQMLDSSILMLLGTPLHWWFWQQSFFRRLWNTANRKKHGLRLNSKQPKSRSKVTITSHCVYTTVRVSGNPMPVL